MTLTIPGSVVPAPPESVKEGSSTSTPSSANNEQPQPTSVAPSLATSNVGNTAITPTTISSIPQPQQLLTFEEQLFLKPYAYESMEIKQAIPAEVVQLWIEVGNGIDKSQTVVWKSAVDSLDFAIKFLSVSADARHFVEQYAGPIIGILVEQQPAKIGMHERNCVQESLLLACLLTVKDLSIQIQRGPLSECVLLNSTMGHVFNKKKAFYKGNKGTWNVNHHLVGLPEVRLRNIERFRNEGGFRLLTQYLEDKVAYQQYYLKMIQSGAAIAASVGTTTTTTPSVPRSLIPPAMLFPKLDPLHHILQALCDALNSRNSNAAPTPQGVTAGPVVSSVSSDGGTVVAGEIPPLPADRAKEDDAVAIAQAVMKYIHNITEDELKKIPTDNLTMIVQHDLQRIFDRLISTRRESTYQFYSFWRALVLKLISSKSLPLKLYGWEQVSELIDACADHSPPPRQYLVRGAGCTFANGIYHYAGQITTDGYAKHGSDVLYTRVIPPGEANSTVIPANPENPSEATMIGPTSSGGAPGKKLTLFRCTMRSQQKWWFLSEADEEQPGTDRDIDYYQHKSKEHEESHPPRTGWITSRSAGMNPPPTLEPQGWMVPFGKEYDTLEHQLAKWAIENEIVEGVLGDSTIHREVVARSTVLIKFLASMCSKDDEFTPIQDPANLDSGLADDMTTDDNSSSPSCATPSLVTITSKEPNKYCLQPSHLLFAWKTCTRKADAAVSSQVYQLLVQILPSCPSKLAIPLLKAVQTSLHESSEKHDYLNEVAEFCSALASANVIENNSNTSSNKNSSTNSTSGGNPGGLSAASTTVLKEDVREEVLNLLWSVLTYPGASSLKSYDNLKRYVTYELRVEPAGSEHRERFLQSCVAFLSTTVEQHSNGGTVDEVQALRMVKLTRFILEACTRQQADRLVSENGGKLPLLLYSELKAYMHRRKVILGSLNYTGSVVRKVPSMSISSSSLNSTPAQAIDTKQLHSLSLDERLRILRYVYGLSDQTRGSSNGSNFVSIEGVPSPATLTLQMLESLWTLCDTPEDREALMLFIASASHTGKATNYEPLTSNANNVNSQPNALALPQEHLLAPAFTDDVCHSVFLNLFCSVESKYDQLGESGYRSFQFLFKKLRDSRNATTESRKMALDALWRVCLTAGKATVASQAMKDLLSVYVALQQRTNSPQRNVDSGIDDMVTDESNDESFCDRIFQCLERVKMDLKEQAPSAELSAERCMRILNASIGQIQGGVIEGLTTSSTLARLSLLDDNNASLDDALRCLPHGMRGQACYRRIGVIAKRPQMQNNQGQQTYETNSSRMPSTSKFPLDVHPLETLSSLKAKVAAICQCPISSVKPIQINGRARGSSGNDLSHLSVNVVPEDSVMDELGVVQGCEVVFVLAERNMQNSNSNSQTSIGNATARISYMSNDLSSVFFSNDSNFADRLFSMVLDIVESLSWQTDNEDKRMIDTDLEGSESLNFESRSTITYKLIWDLLLAMPTNASIANRIRAAQASNGVGDTTSISSEDAMEVEISVAGSGFESWSQLLDGSSFDRSVYILLAIDSNLQPAPEVLSTVAPITYRQALESKLVEESSAFRKVFIEAGGFNAVVRFFAASGSEKDFHKQIKTRRGNAVALRILKTCLFGTSGIIRELPNNIDSESRIERPTHGILPDEAGSQLLQSLSNVDGLLKSLTSMVVDDKGISSSTISDVLRFLRLLFRSQNAAASFVGLPTAEKFLVILLLWENDKELVVRTSSSINAALQVRRGVHDLILQTRLLADHSLPWLIRAIDDVSVLMESTSEYFDVLEKLIAENQETLSSQLLHDLGTTVCKKLASCPRPSNETDPNEVSTGVLCGCLKLLRALIEHGGGKALREGTNLLLQELGTEKWTNDPIQRMSSNPASNIVEAAEAPIMTDDDECLIDIMGVLFDGFLSPSGITGSSPTSVLAICCDKESRRRGFDAVGAAAKGCGGDGGYLALVQRVQRLIFTAAPRIRHRWGQMSSNVNGDNNHSRGRGGVLSKFSGLRNQGCTCYMNSVLQQLIMMPELRDSMCAAPLPASLRTVGSGVSGKAGELVGKRISLQWETGVSYDALVKAYDASSGMHTIVYLPIQIATVGGNVHQQQFHPDDVARLPPCLPDEFILADGRPGKETGVFEILPSVTVDTEEQKTADGRQQEAIIKETDDEASSRRLLEEFQRTFIHLKVGSKGRCFDPRALVEACSCLKLEFDVWQQNDASEFATKLLDRLEISLKKWAPSHFRYMDHTFGVKQTKQKICRKCGLRTNREEKLLTIDCQIRGKSDIHEALSAMTEVEIMEGSNRVYCDNCKENTDTILKSAISTLPNMLILSLKRFDLDFTTFETVKLNSRCAFGQTLNMKQYTLEGLEALEKATSKDKENGDPKAIETDDSKNQNLQQDVLGSLPDDDYEYHLAGVLVHAGVAQGGHYYSFIKDRNPGSEDKWYRFDDEDVTPFDPAAIETECFGGKVKKETKWPNGQIHTVEQEQFANALMLFYEKVKPTDIDQDESLPENNQDPNIQALPTTTGYDVFEADVIRSNANHQRQSFLFDSEFQAFLKGLLDFCRLTKKNERGALNEAGSVVTWREKVVQMLLSYVFDVLFYSSDCSTFSEWSRMLEDILFHDAPSAESFVRKLAWKTSEVSANWFRTFLLECPDSLIRSSAAHIFFSGIRGCVASNRELKELDPWCRAWKEQLAEFNKIRAERASIEFREIPLTLKGKWSIMENVQKIGDGASSLGIIISQLNILLEAMPRCWRFSPELCLFIRYLTTLSTANNDYVLRRSMIEAQIPGRLISLAARDRVPNILRDSFPGASVAPEVANTQIRAESNPTAHVLPMSGNQVLNTDLNNPRGPGASDVSVLVEALACFCGLPCVVHSSLVRETEDVVRGRQRYILSEGAMKALSVVFHESCIPGNPGMGQREIEAYLRRCGVDTGSGSTQKILEMLSKYPTTGGTDPKGGAYLSLEGFLAYYRDLVQNNDIRLRNDLHTFGFRPDLTRRSRESRFFLLGERETQRIPPESVAWDVAEILKDKPVELGTLANFALTSVLSLYSMAHNISEALMEYLAAATLYKKESEPFTNRVLQSIYSTATDWNGNEQVACLTTMLQVIASIPGDDQQTRIGRIMLTNAKAARNVDFGAGLLQVLRGLHRLRQAHSFNHDFTFTYGRYIHILKELQNCYPIFKWMNEHRNQWNFIERELLESRNPSANQTQIRHDYGSRDNENTLPLEQNTHSDSDMAGMNDSEEDEDSQFDTGDNVEIGQNFMAVTGEGPQLAIVERAGNVAVNGTYTRAGIFEDATHYVREDIWDGKQQKFHIFLCNVSNNTKHWYISIVPSNCNPGTSSDIDFYTAPMASGSKFLPPLIGWVKAQEGKDPPPRIRFVVEDDDADEGEDAEIYRHGDIVEDDSANV